MAELIALLLIFGGLTLLHMALSRWSNADRTRIDPYFVPHRNY